MGTVFLNRKLEAGSSTVTSNQPPVGRPTHMSCPSTNPFTARCKVQMAILSRLLSWSIHWLCDPKNVTIDREEFNPAKAAT